jgi:dihydrofolate reductase
MDISIIVAVANNHVIGKDNHLLWHLSGDMKHFRALTTGNTVIMGRKTFDSIGKALPNRRNIVLSRSLESINGCEVYSDVENLLADPSLKHEKIFIMGGGEIYRIFFPLVKKIYLTTVDVEIDGDTTFPEIGDEWIEYSNESFKADDKNDYDFRFINYIRK